MAKTFNLLIFLGVLLLKLVTCMESNQNFSYAVDQSQTKALFISFMLESFHGKLEGKMKELVGQLDLYFASEDYTSSVQSNPSKKGHLETIAFNKVLKELVHYTIEAYDGIKIAGKPCLLCTTERLAIIFNQTLSNPQIAVPFIVEEVLRDLPLNCPGWQRLTMNDDIWLEFEQASQDYFDDQKVFLALRSKLSGEEGLCAASIYRFDCDCTQCEYNAITESLCKQYNEINRTYNHLLGEISVISGRIHDAKPNIKASTKKQGFCCPETPLKIRVFRADSSLPSRKQTRKEDSPMPNFRLIHEYSLAFRKHFFDNLLRGTFISFYNNRRRS